MDDKSEKTASEQVNSMNFLDKLHEISMTKPEVWNSLKNNEYRQVRQEENSAAKGTKYGDPQVRPQDTIDKMVRQG